MWNAYLCILVVFVAVVALPFVLVRNETRRVHLYLFICGAPAALFVPAYLSASRGNADYWHRLLMVVALLLSFSLMLVGSTLVVRARRQRGVRRDLGIGLLLATLPFVFIYLVDIP